MVVTVPSFHCLSVWRIPEEWVVRRSFAPCWSCLNGTCMKKKNSHQILLVGCLSCPQKDCSSNKCPLGVSKRGRVRFHQAEERGSWGTHLLRLHGSLCSLKAPYLSLRSGRSARCTSAQRPALQQGLSQTLTASPSVESCFFSYMIVSFVWEELQNVRLLTTLPSSKRMTIFLLLLLI